MGLDTNICKDDTVTLISVNGGINLWSTGETIDSIFVFEEGVYYVISTQDLCKIVDTININILSNPEIEFPDSIFLCDGENTILDAYSEFAQYTWQDESKDSAFKVTEEGVYFVTIENKCETDTAETYVAFDLVKNMFFPNVITPNNDQLNDHFEVGGAENCTLEFNVFNRWGGSVYSSSDYQNDWPSTELSEGTYFYSICGKHFGCQQKGWIQLIR